MAKSYLDEPLDGRRTFWDWCKEPMVLAALCGFLLTTIGSIVIMLVV